MERFKNKYFKDLKKFKNKYFKNFERVQNHKGKWNLQNKVTKEFISDIWFDKVSLWMFGNDFGWDGMIYLESPIKTPNSAYPYFVPKYRFWIFDSDGHFLRKGINERGCGISGL